MTYEELYVAVSELRSKADYFFKQPTAEDLKRFNSDIEKLLNYLDKISKAPTLYPFPEKDKEEKENITESDLIIKQIEHYIKSTAIVSSPASTLAKTSPPPPSASTSSSTSPFAETIFNKPSPNPFSSTPLLAEGAILNTDAMPAGKSSSAPNRNKLKRTANYQFSLTAYRTDPNRVQDINQPPPTKKSRTVQQTEPRLLNFKLLTPASDPNKQDEFVRPSISASNLLFLRRIKPYLDKALAQPPITYPTLKA